MSQENEALPKAELILHGHLFRFDAPDEATAFLETLFNASTNRAALYREVMLSTTEAMLNEIFQDLTPMDKITGAILLARKYGKIYDPSSKLFSEGDPTKVMHEGAL